MKKTILLIIVSLALFTFACVEKKKTSIEVGSLVGEWVREGYKEILMDNHSPMNVGDILVGHCGISIASTEDYKVMILINNHEGMPGNLQSDETELGFKLKSDIEGYDNIYFSLEGSEENSTLIMRFYNDNGEVEEEERYVKASQVTDVFNPFGMAAIDVLLKGEWTLLDKEGTRVAEITVDSQGKVTGWKEYTSVLIGTDAMFGGSDFVLVFNDKGEQTCYIADFAKEKITLYEAIPDPEGSPNDLKGNLVYSLTK